jgi:ech hydrogenase subunit E
MPNPTNKSIIPFGPQHPVFPEPLQLRLVLQDEKVLEALPMIGYVHRGLEKIAEKKDFVQDVYLIERICGICSFMHALTYCQGIEELMSLQVPERAKFLRVIWAELHRMHSHLLYLGLVADAFGFENLFMQTWRAREEILDVMEATTGGRIMLSVCSIGGVRRDLTTDGIRLIVKTLERVEHQFAEILPPFLHDYSVKERMVGVGTVTPERARELGAVGPTLRACGIKYDLRETGYAAYGQLDFQPVVHEGGDAYARTWVRVDELATSIALIRKALAMLPPGEIAVAFKGNPKGEVVSRVEQPRGEVLYYIRANGTKHLERFRVRTPTFANLAPLLDMLPGCELADVPVIVLSIDPCISCTER